MADTYSLSTDIGKVRLYAQDTNINASALTDAEWQVFIDGAANNNLRLAAAWGLRTMAFDTARMGRWMEAKVAVDAAANMAVTLAKWLEEQAASVDAVESGQVVLFEVL